jgi:hypothetical protein
MNQLQASIAFEKARAILDQSNGGVRDQTAYIRFCLACDAIAQAMGDAEAWKAEIVSLATDLWGEESTAARAGVIRVQIFNALADLQKRQV